MFSIRNLTLNYEGEDSLFSSLSLDIERGKPTLIISEPGEGKTSFAKLLTGVADKFYAASYSGTFSYDGLDLFSLSVPIRKSYVARSIQKTAELEVEKLRDFHQKMWIFVHGIATLLANHTIQLTPLQIEALLKAQFQALLLYEKNKQKEEE